MSITKLKMATIRELITCKRVSILCLLFVFLCCIIAPLVTMGLIDILVSLKFGYDDKCNDTLISMSTWLLVAGIINMVYYVLPGIFMLNDLFFKDTKTNDNPIVLLISSIMYLVNIYWTIFGTVNVVIFDNFCVEDFDMNNVYVLTLFSLVSSYVTIVPMTLYFISYFWNKN